MFRKINSTVRSTATGLAFEGVIDHQSIPGLLARMPEVSVDKPVLDLSAVSRIDSAGLAFLIHWGERQVQPTQKISLTGVSVQARQLIDTMKLDSVFDIQDVDVQARDEQVAEVQTDEVVSQNPESPIASAP